MLTDVSPDHAATARRSSARRLDPGASRTPTRRSPSPHDTEYGLGANIYTSNLDWAMKAMDEIKAGTFWINDPLTDNDAGAVRRHAQERHGPRARRGGPRRLPRDQARPPGLRAGVKSYWFPYQNRSGEIPR